jgi:hypothetical protein
MENVAAPLVPAEVETVTLRGPTAAVELIVKVVVIDVALTTVTGPTDTSLLPVETVAPEVKLVPVSDTLTTAPCRPEAGLIDTSVGGAGTTVKVTALLVPAAVETVTFRGPGVAAESIVNDVLRKPEPAPKPTVLWVMPPPLIVIVVAPDTKFVPASVTFTTVPCMPEDGLTDDSVGAGKIVKLPPWFEPPPGPGFVTPMTKLPEADSSVEGIVAVRRVEETNAVTIGVPPNVTCELDTKFVPVTCNVVTDAPAPADVGVKAETVGAGFNTLTVNVAVPPPGAGLDINPLSVPATAVWFAGSANDIVLPERTPAMPSRVPVVELMNPVPATTTVVAPEPAWTELGVTVDTVGPGFVWAFTVKGNKALNPPPGAGFVTETINAPATSCARGITSVMELSDVDVGEYRFPPKLMTEVRLKLFPLRVSVKSATPARVSVGERLNNDGRGFSGWIWVV